jgi:ankyrin repeat protein
MLLTKTRPILTASPSEKQFEYAAKETQRGKIVTALLVQGAQIDLRDCFGAGLLHLACGGCGCQVSNAILEQVRHHDATLLQKHMNDIDNDGMNPLHILCQKAGSIPMGAVLAAAVEVNALVVACKFLLKHGIDPKAKCYGTTTALMQLAWGTPNLVSVQMARAMLASSCDPCFEHEGKCCTSITSYIHGLFPILHVLIFPRGILFCLVQRLVRFAHCLEARGAKRDV